jgi:hypothetical protein
MGLLPDPWNWPIWGVYKVHTWGFGPGRTGSLFRGLWASECVQISFMGPLPGGSGVRCLLRCHARKLTASGAGTSSMFRFGPNRMAGTRAAGGPWLIPG